MEYAIPHRTNAKPSWKGEFDDLGSLAKNLGEAVKRAIVSGADLSGTKLSGADLSNADLSGTKLSGADLSNANLWRANLSNANLWRANLSNANLWRANLSGTKLSDADLSDADLSNANLSNADLSGTNLSNADLSNANLWRATLSDADLRDAKLARVLQVGPLGSRRAYLTIWCMADGARRYSTGCQAQISEDDFVGRVKAVHGNSEHGVAYMAAVAFAKAVMAGKRVDIDDRDQRLAQQSRDLTEAAKRILSLEAQLAEARDKALRMEDERNAWRSGHQDRTNEADDIRAQVAALQAGGGVVLPDDETLLDDAWRNHFDPLNGPADLFDAGRVAMLKCIRSRLQSVDPAKVLGEGEEKRAPDCEWSQIEDGSDTWSTDCGNEYTISHGWDPIETNCPFCPCCGGKISLRSSKGGA